MFFFPFSLFLLKIKHEISQVCKLMSSISVLPLPAVSFVFSALVPGCFGSSLPAQAGIQTRARNSAP